MTRAEDQEFARGYEDARRGEAGDGNLYVAKPASLLRMVDVFLNGEPKPYQYGWFKFVYDRDKGGK